MTQHVEVVRDGRVLEVTLNRPKVNAIDHAMSRELGDAFKRLRDDPELRTGDLPVYRAMLKSEDAAEGVRAFMDKRKPEFKGR